MRIHSDVLIPAHLSIALSRAGLSDVWIEGFSAHRSTKRGRAFEFRLAAEPKKGRRRRNTGTYGAESDGIAAATWDEHGQWMARLFEVDPEAVIGPYDGREAFHAATKDRYQIEVRS